MNKEDGKRSCRSVENLFGKGPGKVKGVHAGPPTAILQYFVVSLPGEDFVGKGKLYTSIRGRQRRDSRGKNRRFIQRKTLHKGRGKESLTGTHKVYGTREESPLRRSGGQRRRSELFGCTPIRVGWAFRDSKVIIKG